MHLKIDLLLVCFWILLLPPNNTMLSFWQKLVFFDDLCASFILSLKGLSTQKWTELSHFDEVHRGSKQSV